MDWWLTKGRWPEADGDVETFGVAATLSGA